MNWDQARNLLRMAGRRSRAQHELPMNGRPRDDAPLTGVRAGSVCVVSGKGGTGKSVVSASLAKLLSKCGRTLIVDADLGVGNAHILQNVAPKHSFVDVVEGRSDVREVVSACGAQLDLLAGGSGVSHMSSLSTYELHMVASGIERLERDYKFVIVDSAAGISAQTIAFAAACDVVLLVTTPDLTAMTDAYAFLKVLLQRNPAADPLMIVNRAHSYDEAEHVAERMRNVSDKFLHRAPRWLGSLPEDPAVMRSVNQRSPVVDAEPRSACAQALRGISVGVLEELSRMHHSGVGHTLVRQTGYSAGVV